MVRKSLQEDYPLWIGSFWLILKQQQKQPVNASSIWNLLSDATLLGALLTCKKLQEQQQDNNNDKTSNEDTKEDVRQLPLGLEEFVLKPWSDSTTSSQPSSSKPPQANPQRYLEMLVHNVSHTDLVLSLEAPLLPSNNGDTTTNDPPSEDDRYCLCRPRFSAFDQYSTRVLESLTDLNPLIYFPRYERSDATPRYAIKREPSPMKKLPIGFALDHSSSSIVVTRDELTDLRVRGRDAPRIPHVSENTCLNAVFFPLLASLLPQWQSKIQEKYASHTVGPKQVLVLVSGVGTPRNWTHSMSGNSTAKCAQLIQRFVQALFPEVVVVQVHSAHSNIFRYDEQISFVQNHFLPCIQSYRDAHAKGLPYPDEQLLSPSTIDDKPFSTEWRKSMHITLSFADGSPARNHAIQAALRTYRPTYFHCWQLKTFWHESKIVDSDIEVHSFEEMETLPPVETNQLHDKVLLQVIEDMKAFRNDMANILNQSNDIYKFWLRKTHKPVLAVLAAKVKGKIKLYRGTNMEVSMPTGSLCAERNVIGTALADNPALKRQDLRVIAVLSVPPPPSSSMSHSASTASLTGMLPSPAPETADHLLLSPPSIHHQKDPKTFLPWSTNNGSNANAVEDEEWVLQDVATSKHSLPPLAPALSSASHTACIPPIIASTPPTMASAGGGETILPSFALEPSASPGSTPARRIHLYNHLAAKHRVSKQRRTVVVHSDEVRAL